MTTDVFLDTNVIVYLFASDERKRARSEALLADGATVSVQVLNETALTLRRKLNRSWRQIEDMSSRVRQVCAVVPVTEAVHVGGLAVAARWKLHLYDSTIVAAALSAGCKVLLSEDMQDGRVIDGLTIRNPYA